jgi:branched-chain amino acid aminotransferase
VAETNATNLFAVIDAGLITPRPVACPEGITRRTVLALAEANAIPYEVRDVSLAEFYAAEEVFCTGTMGEIAGVVAIDGRSIGDGVPGVVTRRVAGLYGEHVRAHARPL